jgi:putative CocE/NonD family hydrolase
VNFLDFPKFDTNTMISRRRTVLPSASARVFARIFSTVFTVILAALAAFLPCERVLAQAAPLPAVQDVDILWGVKIPMRDGTKLNATIVRPRDQREALPVIFTFTPYIADSYLSRGVYFAKNDYVFALVDVRGRGNSEASPKGIASAMSFEPFQHEGRDGHDVVEWLSAQAWSNGKVTMWGGSYAGWNQWATLKEAPKHLVTAVPAASCYPGLDFPMTRNIVGSYTMRWLAFTSGVAGNSVLFNNEEYWNAKYHARYMAHLPFRVLDSIAGNFTTQWQQWLKHPSRDEYWAALSPSAEHYKRMTQPILSITGHYDGDQLGALEYYKQHQLYASEAAKKEHYLIIGPWDHAGTRTPTRVVGGVDFGDASLLDMNKLHKEWYDWTMKNDGKSDGKNDGKNDAANTTKSPTKPEFLKDRVAYYRVAASPQRSLWKYAPSLEAIATQRKALYLHSGVSAYLLSAKAVSDEASGKSEQMKKDELKKNDVKKNELKKNENNEPPKGSNESDALTGNLDVLAGAQRVNTISGLFANDILHSGGLNERKPTSESHDTYLYNPLDLSAAEYEMKPSPDYLTDQTLALALRGNGLIYHTEPFTEETELTGSPKLSLWMSIDAPDTDFQVLLYELLPNGTSVLLSSDQLRARYRTNPAKPVLIKPEEFGKPLRYEFDQFTFVSRLVSRGSRLRLLVLSPNSMHLQKNYNSGRSVAEETARDARSVRVNLYHDAEHPSLLELPLVK